MTTPAFTRAGAGPPLVLLHGLGFSRQAWDPVIPALAEHFDVLAIDLPGCGHVPMADNPGAVTALITAAAARGMRAGAGCIR